MLHLLPFVHSKSCNFAKKISNFFFLNQKKKYILFDTVSRIGEKKIFHARAPCRSWLFLRWKTCPYISRATVQMHPRKNPINSFRSIRAESISFNLKKNHVTMMIFSRRYHRSNLGNFGNFGIEIFYTI